MIRRELLYYMFVGSVHKAENFNAAGGKDFDVAGGGDFEDEVGGDFDIGSSPIVVQDDGNISPLPSIQQSQVSLPLITKNRLHKILRNQVFQLIWLS